MPRILTAPDGPARVVGTTTTTKLATRVLATARVIHDGLPAGFGAVSPMTLLLEMYVAEESAQYLTIDELGSPEGGSAVLCQRWIKALARAGLVEQSNVAVALTDQGYRTVTETLERLFNEQRRLD